jgi:choline dehydrogenase-like flavoprotein
MVLAHELGQMGFDVLLVEAGKRRGGGKSQRLYAGEVADTERHLSPDRDRFRGLGGSTQAWGGRCMPFDPVDFVPRPDIGAPGWPISATDMDPWYRKAQGYVDCGGYAYRAAEAGLEGDLIAGFSSDAVLTDTLERWSPPTHFGKALFPALEAMPNVTVLTSAVVSGFEHADGAVSTVHLKTLPKLRAAQVSAKTIILAGGGLETARLLLNTATADQVALGDQSGWLGRGYMCHVMGTVARIKLNPDVKAIFGFEKDAENIYVRRRLTLADDALRQHGLPNIYTLLDRPLMGDADHGSALLSLTYLAKRILQPQSRGGATESDSAVMAHLRNLIFGAPQALSVLPKFGRERFLQGRRLPSLLEGGEDNTYYLTYHSEQTPSRDSRVHLSETRDATGLRQLRIDPHQNAQDVEGIVTAHRLIGEALERAGVGHLEFLGDDPAALVRASKFTLGHHIGTTRMSATPEDGVVDANLKVHGTQNLFAASASVFPTSSQAHPTLTIVALAIRLAHHLRGLQSVTQARASA